MISHHTNLKRNLIFTALCFVLMMCPIWFVPSAHAAIRTITGVVDKVIDGDTLHVITPDQTRIKVRLYGIDAPETVKVNVHTGQVVKPGQPYGAEAWKALEGRVLGRQVTIEVMDVDKYHRLVGIVWLGDRDINLELLQKGFAEAFTEYLKPPFRTPYLRAERNAKQAMMGIWSLSDYERPADFRRRIKTGG